MKKSLLMKSILLLFALVVGTSSSWALTKTEGFETKATSTTYNSTVTIGTSESDCGIAWSIYYGTVSTNDKISGTNSAQMRFYTGMTGWPYIMTTTPIDGLTNVSFKARTSDTKNKMDVSCSSDGETWTVVSSANTFEAAKTAYDFSVNLPSGSKYIKIGFNSESTGATKSNIVVDDVVFTYTSSLQAPTWSVDPASASVDQGNNTTLQLTTNYDGTLNFVSNDEDVATVSYNSSTKVITVTGVGAGNTTITATGAATSTYEAVSKTINVTVTYPELPSNVADVMGPLGYSYFGLTPSGSNTYVNLDDESVDNTDTYGVNITFTRNSSKDPVPTKLRFDGNYMRFYKGNSLTMTAPAGSYIRKIVFTEPSSGAAWAGSMTADKGVYISSVKTWYAKTEDVTSVVLTNDNTKRVGGIEVYLNASYVTTPAVSSAGWATYVTPCDVQFTEGDAFAVTSVGETSLSLTSVTSVPSGTPLLLKGAGTKTATALSETPAAITNKLAVSDGTKGVNDYVLANHNSKVGFYKWKGSALAAGKVYLPASEVAGAREFIGFDNDATGIANVNNEAKTLFNGDFYNVAGQRVAQPTKGLYIVNGKKVIIK